MQTQTRIKVRPEQLDTDEFSSAFGRLQSEFKQKYGRDFRITGTETKIHQNLHGSGRARDIGGADLSDDEGGFLVERGKALGLDVGDYRKNWRDINGTGPHIHVDYSEKLRGQGITPASSSSGIVKVKADEVEDLPEFDMPGAISSIGTALRPVGMPPVRSTRASVARPQIGEGVDPTPSQIGQYQEYLRNKTKSYPGAGSAVTTSPPVRMATAPPINKPPIPNKPIARAKSGLSAQDVSRSLSALTLPSASGIKAGPASAAPGFESLVSIQADPPGMVTRRDLLQQGLSPEQRAKVEQYDREAEARLEKARQEHKAGSRQIGPYRVTALDPERVSLGDTATSILADNPAVRGAEYVSTLLAGLSRGGFADMGARYGNEDYSVNSVFEAAAHKFYTGETRPGYEWITGVAIKDAAQKAGIDPNNEGVQILANTLDLAADPTVLVGAGELKALTGAKRLTALERLKGVADEAARIRPRSASAIPESVKTPATVAAPPAPNLKYVRSADGRVGVVQIGKDGAAQFDEIKNPRSVRRAASQATTDLPADEFDSLFPRQPEGYQPGSVEAARNQFATDEGIAPRPVSQPPRRITHDRLGELEVTGRAKDGKLNVVDVDGSSHTIQNPRTQGNRSAAYVKPQAEAQSSGRIKVSADEVSDIAPVVEAPALPSATGRMQEKLRERGFSDHEINRMTLEESTEALRKPPPVEAQAGPRTKPAAPDIVTPARVVEASKIDPSEYVNLGKLNVSDAEKENLGRLVQESVTESKVNPKARVSFDDIRREAAEIDPELLKHLDTPKPGETLHPAVRLAARQRLNALNGEAVTLQKQIEAGRSTLPVKELEQLESRAAILERDAKGLLDVLIPTRSQDGRNLAFHRIMADATGFDNEYWIAKARRSAERSGTDIKSKGYQQTETKIRQTLAEGQDAEAKVTEIQSRIAELRSNPVVVEFERALKEAKQAKVGPATAQRQARRAAADSYKAKLADAEMAARERLKEFFNPNVVHDATDIGRAVADLSVIGAAKLARKGISGAVWAAEMIDEFGEAVRPHIKAIYERSYSMYRGEREASITAARRLRLAGGDLSSVTSEDLDRLLKQADFERNRSRRARLDLALTYRRLEKSHIADIASAYRVTGMLSSARMLAQDIISTGVFQPMEALSTVPGAIHDLVIGAAKKRRGLVAETPASFTKAHVKGGIQGLKEAPQIFKHGATHAQLERLELPSEVNSGSRIIDFIPNAITRIRSAADNVPFQQAYNRELANRAKAIALTEAKQGKISRDQAAARTAEIIKNPSAVDAAESLFDTALVEAAQQDARVSTFNQENLISRTMQGAKTRGGPWGRFFINIPLPFTRAVPNIIWKGVEYSPAGYGVYAGQALKALYHRSFPLEAQRQMSKTFGRATVGTGLTLLAYTFAKQGYVIGTGDLSETEMNRDRVAGRPAVKGSSSPAIYNPLNGTWHEINWLGPAAYPIALGANIAESESLGDFASATKNLFLKQHPVIRGGDQMVNPLRLSEEGLRRQAGQMASSFVPAGSLIRDIATATDDKAREAEGFTAQIQRNIPGWRNQLPEMTDALGQPAQHSRLWSIDPSRTMTAKDKSDPLLSELVRLKVGLPRPEQKPDESKDDFKARSQRQGQFLEQQLTKVIASPIYQKAPEGVDEKVYQRKAIEMAADAAKDGASKGRAPRGGDDAIILFNARVSIEADKIVEQSKHKDYYRRLNSTQRDAFERAIKDAFDGAKASLTSDDDPGSKLVRASGAFSSKMADQASVIQRAVEKARGAR